LTLCYPIPGGSRRKLAALALTRQAQNFLRWQRTGAYTPDGRVFDIGNATAMALARLGSGIQPDRSGGDDSALGNGSLMRSVAIALAGRDLDPDDLADHAERSSAITHGATLARVTCGLYVLSCRRLLRGEEAEAARASATDELRRRYSATSRERFRAALDEVLAWPDRAGSGHVVDSFWSAWEGFADARSYAETIERAIHYGGDTDTTACIAGGMAGIHWGLDAIPPEWLAGMRGREVAQPILDRLIATGPAIPSGPPASPRLM